ncbi:MAG: pyrroline-5-carboxylate reductase [Firmicutes bacterium]|nr:pyrroline-5-carboxylate reductase [Bacillota bacterium]
MIIGFIGTGNMGGAILGGYAASKASEGNELLAYNLNTDHSKWALERTGGRVEIAADNVDLCRRSDVVIIGVKPQVIDPVLEEITGPFKEREDRILVSMAAGISIEHLRSFLGEKAKIVRIMPNTPAMVGEAMTAVARNELVNDEEFAPIKEIFDSIGAAEEIDEALIDCVIGVSGSSPAYTYMYIQALVEAAVANGMDEQKARVFAAQAVLGAAKMVLESPESIEQLRINVCSPGGTTIEAVNKLFENGFMQNAKEGFQAAVDRSIEMTEAKK